MIDHVKRIHQKVRSHPITKHIHHHLTKVIIGGFTLVEILIVTSVIGIVATAGTNSYVNTQERARNVTRKSNINGIAGSITNFYAANRYFPSTLGQLSPNYIPTIPKDPKGIDTCRLASTAGGSFGYKTYTNGGPNGDKKGYMIFSQVERGGAGLPYKDIYILTGTNPCSANWYQVANSVCTNKPGWTENNPGRDVTLLTPGQKNLIDFISPLKARAATGGTGANSKPWTNVVAGTQGGKDPDGDGTKNSQEPNTSARTNPCVPSTWANNCDLDTDEDGKFNSVEGQSTDTDGDTMADYQESSILDQDLDTVSNETDPNNTNPCIPATTNPNCYTDTDDDDDANEGTDSEESDTSDSDGDGIPNYQESAVDDSDGDTIPNQSDPANTDPCDPDPNSPACVSVSMCAGVVSPGTHDLDGDKYKTNSSENSALWDMDDDDPCIPNSRSVACTNPFIHNANATFPGSCSDADNDGLSNKVSRNSPNRDPNDNNPCTPSDNTPSCLARNGRYGSDYDVDNDSYVNNVPPSHSLYDSNDSDPCVPMKRWAGCMADTDGDSKTDYNEGQFTNTDIFTGYSNILAHQLYSGSYTGIINISGFTGGLYGLSGGDSKYNWQESDLNTADSDADGYNNEIDSHDSNSCIPSNFGSGCSLDFDSDGIKDREEGTESNADDTPDFPGGDNWPNWIESILHGATTYLGLFNPAGPVADPDGDLVPNQIDPRNDDPCVPNIYPDSPTCAPLISEEQGGETTSGTNYQIQGIDCSAITSLPYGSRAFYVLIY